MPERFSPGCRSFLPALLLLAMAAAGCRSAKVAYQFPVVPPVFARPAATAPAQPASPATRYLTPTHRTGTAAASVTRPAPRFAQVAQQLARPVFRPGARLHLAERPATQSARTRPAAPSSPAEVGLGTTVLGVLGLIVLPIALIGLAVSGGGLVWAVLAGAAALAVLVAWLDPFEQ